MLQEVQKHATLPPYGLSCVLHQLYKATQGIQAPITKDIQISLRSPWNDSPTKGDK